MRRSDDRCSWIRIGAWLPVLTCALLALTGPASAQPEAPEAPEAPGMPGGGDEEAASVAAPAVRVIAFQDRVGDCDPVEARFGRCVEEVDFVDPLPAFSNRTATRAEQAMWRNAGALYAQLWEDMAHRWFQSGSMIEQTLVLDGMTALPSTAEAWEASVEKDRRLYALPGPELWLDQRRWVSASAETAGAFFRRISYLTPDGQHAQPDMVLLAGRFALRLGFSGRRHDFDLMNGDPTSSGPFFEQMYPYSRAMEASGGELVPLSAFSGYQHVIDRPRMLRTMVEMRRNARQEFYKFSRLLATQIAQFGLEDYTTNHMRVLTALTAMQSPPGSLEERTGRSGDLVAAALGETDTEEAVEKRLEEGIYRLQHGFEINYFQLPMELVREYLAELLRRTELDEQFWADFNDVLVYDLEDLLRAQVGPLNGLDEATIGAWVKSYARPGTSEELVAGHVQRAALNLLVEKLEKDDRDELQTRILLDHVNMEVTSIFDASEGALVAPEALVALTSGKWESVLGKHGYRTAHFAQGLGAVDPTSICTTLDGPSALQEEVFGVVHLDLLFAEVDGLTDPDDILWRARQQLPFIMIDSPENTTPAVERLVGLPGERAIYRARWEIWAGWHLFWSSEPLAGGEASRELLVRTGAVCDDTVLVPPDLVPTLARASLLEGNFRPTTPVMQGEHYRGTRRIVTAGEDELVEAAVDAAAQGEDAEAAAETDVEVAAESPESIPDQVDLSLPDVAGLFGTRGASKKEEAYPSTRYLHQVMRSPLYDLARADGPMMLFVFDSTTSEKRFPLADRRPRTPYARRQIHIPKSRKGEDRYLRSAAWGHFVSTVGKSPEFTLVAPAYRTTESVNTRTEMPRWGRNRTLDWTLLAGLGFMPLRYAKASCNEDYEDGDPSTVACEDAQRYTAGMSIDIAGLATWWVVDDHRLGLELGPAAQLDIGPGGASEMWGDYDSRTNAWTFRPQFGLLVGIRGAPDPSPLVKGARGGLPWGAETPEGASRQDRFQLGGRFGFLMGPGYNGLESTVVSELWLAGSIRRKRSPHASFTPYHPASFVGPYFRFQFEFLLAAEDERFKTLDYGVAAIVGVRGQIRLKKQADSVPEGI